MKHSRLPIPLLLGFLGLASPCFSLAGSPQQKLQIVFPDGRPISAPAAPPVAGSAESREAVIGASVTPYERTITYRGEVYEIQNKGEQVGPLIKDPHMTITRRSDRAKIRFANNVIRLETPDSLSVHDGILTAGDLPRQIDLDRFDAEARFQSRRAPAVSKNARGQVDATSGGTGGEEFEKDVVKLVDQRYSNLMQDAKTDPRFRSPIADEEVIRSLQQTLTKKQAGSLVVTGDSGSGKTVDVRTLIGRAARGKVPEVPRTWRILDFKPNALISGTSLRGEMEKRIQELTSASYEVPITLFVDEAHQLFAGRFAEYADSLKTEIADGQIRVWGTSTSHEYDRDIGGNPPLARRLPKIHRPNPNDDQARAIVQSWVKENKKPALDPTVLDYVMELSEKFNPLMANPSRALALTEEIYSLNHVYASRSSPSLLDVEAGARNIYRLPKTYFNREELKNVIRELPLKLDEEIVGNQHSKEIINDLVEQALTESHDHGRPQIRLLLAGPKGLGKTELAKATIRAAGRGEPHIIAMEDYGPRGKSTEEFKKALAAVLNENQFAGVIFDEIEKASKDVQQTLIHIKWDGTFRVKMEDGTEPVISSRNAFLFETTNAGADYIEGGERDPKKLLEAMRHDGLSEVVIDRSQAVLEFHPPTRDEYRAMVAQELKKELRVQAVNHRKSAITIRNEAAFVDTMTRDHYTPTSNGRDVGRLIQNQVRTVIARASLDDTLHASPKWELEYKPGDGHFRTSFCVHQALEGQLGHGGAQQP